MARMFRSVIRQAEKHISRKEKEDTIKIQNLIDELKIAIIQENEEKAAEIEDMLIDELEMLD